MSGAVSSWDWIRHNQLTVRLRGAGEGRGEETVPGGGVGQHLDAVVGVGPQSGQGRAGPDDGAEPGGVELGLVWLEPVREGDEENSVSLDLTIDQVMRRSSPLEMESGGG